MAGAPPVDAAPPVASAAEAPPLDVVFRQDGAPVDAAAADEFVDYHSRNGGAEGLVRVPPSPRLAAMKPERGRTPVRHPCGNGHGGPWQRGSQ